jgi:hypothetical protein
MLASKRIAAIPPREPAEEKKVPHDAGRGSKTHKRNSRKDGEHSLIEEAADGCRRGACRETRAAVKGRPQGSVSPDGELNERTAIGRVRENKRKGLPRKKAG